MDHVHEAVKYLGYAGDTSGDHLNAANEGTLNALTGIGHALLALNQTIADALRDAG